jgi:hypothetical protein
MYYDELTSDSAGVRLGGSILNAIIVVCGITGMTFLMVLCFKYRLYKVRACIVCVICQIIYFMSCIVSIFLAGIVSSVHSRCNNYSYMDVRHASRAILKKKISYSPSIFVGR